jgi:hypothetical protein
MTGVMVAAANTAAIKVANSLFIVSSSLVVSEWLLAQPTVLFFGQCQ